MSKAGKLIIFNMEEFVFDHHLNLPGLPGNKKDVEILQETFGKYNVDTSAVHTNLNKEEVRVEMELVKNEDFSEFKYLAVAILSHGDRKNALYSNCGVFDLYDDVIFPILRNPTLCDKPKLFMIDACKGKYAMDQLSTDGIPNKTFFPEKVLKCYATSEGFKAYQTAMGSIFMLQFCNLLQKHGNTNSVEDIMRDAIEAVQLQSDGQQVPSFSSNFNKRDSEDFILGRM